MPAVSLPPRDPDAIQRELLSILRSRAANDDAPVRLVKGEG